MDDTTIETERLRIVAFSEEHLTAKYVSWMNDPEVVRFSNQRHRVHTLESCREFWLSFTGTPHRFWAITAKDPAIGHIGNMHARIDSVHSIADVAILLGEKQYWGSGYGQEAWGATCGYLLRTMGMRKVTAGTLATNKPMLALMHRSGMTEDGIRVRHMLAEGQEVDIVHGALFGDAF